MNIQIHLATNVAAARSRDLWLRDSKYSDFQILFTYTVDEGMLKSGSIMATQYDGDYIRLKQMNKILELMHFVTLNQDFKPILFPQKTYNRITLKIRPMALP